LPAAIGFGADRLAVGFDALGKPAGRNRFLVTRRLQEQFKHEGARAMPLGVSR
jgi:hypothetical protein